MINQSEYVQRRKKLVELIQGQRQAPGVVVISAQPEMGSQRFIQDATFEYFSGIQEPAGVLTIDCQTGHTMLWVPNTQGRRAQWVAHTHEADMANARLAGVDEITYLGQAIPGYQLAPLSAMAVYQHLCVYLKAVLDRGQSIFACRTSGDTHFLNQHWFIDRLSHWVSGLAENICDISALVCRMRRVKSRSEIECMYKAVELTVAAQIAAAELVRPGCYEREIQAAIEYVFTSNGAQSAFVPLVAGGRNASIIHYDVGAHQLQNGELVIIDCGARVSGYCADLSRTYPVGKKFTPKQHDIYQLVYDAQAYIAECIRPGMWLNNAQYPEQSLHHMAMQFFAKHGCEKYFVHGIGHYLGLEVHDVGSLSEPLQDGDVITIEPGLYRTDEGMGVRLEDDYWVIKDGAHCLSLDMQKAPEEIQALMQR